MNLLPIFAVTLAAFLLVVVGMAVGVLLGRKAISGSCGGLGSGAEGESNTACSLCSNPEAACRELGRRMNQPSCGASPGSMDSSECDKDCVAEGCSKEAIDACKQG